MCLVLCNEEGSSQVSANTERRDMGLYEVPLSVSLLGFVLICQWICLFYVLRI